MAVDTSQRDAVRAAIRKQYDDSVVMAGSHMPQVARIPFSILGLNYITGGGAPMNRMLRFWGGWRSCKSLSCWDLVRQAQNYDTVMYAQLEHQAEIARIVGDKKLADELHALAETTAERWEGGMECAYFNVETQFDPLYVADLGVDVDRLEVVNKTRIEDIGTILVEMLRAWHVLIIDSCSNAISVRELKAEDGLYQEHVGVRPKKWGEVLGWVNDRMQPDNTVVYIDQIRSPIGMNLNQRMASEKPPGGKQMEHNSSMTLHFMKGGQLFRKPDGSLAKRDPTDQSKGDVGAFGKVEPEGAEILVRCDKSRVSRSERTALLHYDHVEQDFDRLHDYEKLAKYFGVVKRTSAQSSWYQLPDGRKTQKLRDHLHGDETLRAAVEDMTLKCAADPAFERDLLRSLA